MGKESSSRQRGYTSKCFFSRVSGERRSLLSLNEFDPEVLDKTVEVFSLHQFKKVAVYDLEKISINTRKHSTKRGYIAIFPKFLVDEILHLRDVEFKESLVRKSRMFACPDVIDPSLLRKFHYNWFMDHV